MAHYFIVQLLQPSDSEDKDTSDSGVDHITDSEGTDATSVKLVVPVAEITGAEREDLDRTQSSRAA